MTTITHRILDTKDSDSICSRGVETQIDLDGGNGCIIVTFDNGAYIGLECEDGTLVAKFFLSNDSKTVEVEWNNEKGTFVVR